MKVLIISRGLPDDKYPLYGVFEFDQAKALVAHGVEVVYFAIDIRSARRIRKWGYRHEMIDGVRCHIASIPVGAVPLPVQTAAAKHCLRKLYRRVFSGTDRPDVIHAHFTFEGYIASFLAREKSIPLIITEHSSKMNTPVPEPQELNMADTGYHAAHTVVAVSRGLAENIQKSTGISCTVIPNMVDTELFSRPAGKPREDGIFRFLSVGTLSEGKGFLELLEAFSILHSRYPNTELTIVGQGPLRSHVQEQCRQAGLESCVTLTGQLPRDEIAEQLHQSDAFVLLSRKETFGVVYIEAMASGLPVIATRCKGPEDFVTSENGLLVEVGAVQEAADAMETMIRQYERFDRERIRSATRDKYSGGYLAQQLTALYEQAVSHCTEDTTE